MFNEDFYPTKRETVETMIMGLELHGKSALDPQAGKGNIIDVLNEMGAVTYSYEKEKDLAKIVSSKSKFMGFDFLQATSIDVSHIDFIVMNPPFTRDEDHLIHAFNIAPKGCQIISLLSKTSLDPHSRLKKKMELNSIIQNHGYYEDLGRVFTDAERITSVDVVLVKLTKPGQKGKDEWEGFLEDVEEDIDRTVQGVMQYSELREIIERYISAVNTFDEVIEASAKINSYASIFGHNNRIHFGAHKSGENYTSSISRDQYKKELQKAAWMTVFQKLKLDRFITTSVREKLNAYVESEQNKPFTERNVMNMISAIYQTTEGNMKESLVEIFDKITRHTKENRFNVEGWVTNSNYLLGKKIIFPWICSVGWEGKFEIKWQSQYNLDDLTKALCYFMGVDYSTIGSIHDFPKSRRIKDREHYDTEERREMYENRYDSITKQHYDVKVTKEEYVNEQIERDVKKADEYERIEFGQWYDWGFFEVKGFKKGTMHVKFKDEDVWARVNQIIAEVKGYPLPEKFK